MSIFFVFTTAARWGRVGFDPRHDTPTFVQAGSADHSCSGQVPQFVRGGGEGGITEGQFAGHDLSRGIGEKSCPVAVQTVN